MTRFLLARSHRARRRELVAGHGIPAELVPEPMLITCPQCGDELFAGIGPDESEPRFLESDERILSCESVYIVLGVAEQD